MFICHDTTVHSDICCYRDQCCEFTASGGSKYSLVCLTPCVCICVCVCVSEWVHTCTFTALMHPFILLWNKKTDQGASGHFSTKSFNLLFSSLIKSFILHLNDSRFMCFWYKYPYCEQQGQSSHIPSYLTLKKRTFSIFEQRKPLLSAARLYPSPPLGGSVLLILVPLLNSLSHISCNT